VSSRATLNGEGVGVSTEKSVHPFLHGWIEMSLRDQGDNLMTFVAPGRGWERQQCIED
jgi:hypothetical protein